MVEFLVSFALENLANFATDEVKLLCGTEEEIDKLHRKLTAIQACLHDAEKRKIKEMAVEDWVNKLIDVAYEVDDVLDEWKVKAQLVSLNDACYGRSVWKFFTSCTCLQHPVKYHNIGIRTKEINKKLDQIAKDKIEFSFQENATVDVVGSSRMTISWVDTSDVFGREDEKNMIKSMLISEGSSESSNISVISIVGTGGFGKTTLAQFVYNDDQVKCHFEELIWVCISDDFDVQKIIRKIIEVIKNTAPSVNELEALKKSLCEILKNKRFLLVLDDVWNEDNGKWEMLKNILYACEAKESWIVVTTRIENVARVMGSKNICQLGPLSSEDSMLVFNKVAFQDIHGSEPSELMEVGSKIVEKCKGSPLAIKTVAGALRTTKMTVDEWEIVLNADIWDWSKSQADILPALLLSYYHLSPELRQCFRYCAIFPKDYDIEKEDLVRMWVAQGYIPHEMEDLGAEYFDQLLGRSFFQEPKKDEFGNITECKMHDLVHDLAQFVTKGEFTLIDISTNKKILNTRKARHSVPFEGDPFKDLNDAKSLRTLVVDRFSYLDSICGSDGLFEQLRCIRMLRLPLLVSKTLPKSIGRLVHLRYLDLSDSNTEALPESVGNLRNLKYLDLNRTEIEALPESVGNLWNLKYLDLSSTKIEALPDSVGNLRNLKCLDLSRTNIKALPEGVGKLERLRYLNLEWSAIEELPKSITSLCHLKSLNLRWCESLRRLPDGLQKMTSLENLLIAEIYELKTFPAGIGRLTSLKRLDRFIVTPGSCNLKELRDLNRLTGFLEIENLKDAGSKEEADAAKLTDKKFIRTIALKWLVGYAEWPSDGISPTREEEESKQRTAEGVLEALQPLPSLQELFIWGYLGSTFPSWVGDPTFSGLVDVRLRDCPNCTRLPVLHMLPQLRRLNIGVIPMLRKLGGEFFGSKNGFPKLESLEFYGMENWEEWEEEIASMPCLLSLEMSFCNKLKALPSGFSEALKKVTIRGPNQSWVGFIPPSVEKINLLQDGSADMISKLPSLPKLKCLEINSDDELTELSNDLVRFSALQTLQLWSCTNLNSLPEEMSLLKELKELRAVNCPNLRENYKEGSENWSKIAHIPHIDI